MTTPAPKAPSKTTAPRKTSTTKTPAPQAPSAGTGRKSLEQHLETISAGEVMTPEELYDFLESLRALSQGLAFCAHAGAAQLQAAARKAARDRTDDGRMTLAQKGKMRMILLRMSRQLNSGSAEALLSSATGAVKTWALMEAFLDELESSQVSRPHRSAKGGFNVYGGR